MPLPAAAGALALPQGLAIAWRGRPAVLQELLLDVGYLPYLSSDVLVLNMLLPLQLTLRKVGLDLRVCSFVTGMALIGTIGVRSASLRRLPLAHRQYIREHSALGLVVPRELLGVVILLIRHLLSRHFVDWNRRLEVAASIRPDRRPLLLEVLAFSILFLGPGDAVCVVELL